MASAGDLGRPLPTPPELSAEGQRVSVRTVRPADVEPYQAAVRASAERMAEWNPVTLDDLPHRIATQSADNRTFFVVANEPVGDHPFVGRVNLFGAVRGRFRSITMGYDSYDPYAGRGLFAEGLRLIVDLALTDAAAGGMGLHRVEANVQPGNVRSAGLLRSLGFRHEGSAPNFLYLPDQTGREQWRPHERYAVTGEDWPAPAYAAVVARRVVALFDDGGAAAGAAFARALSVEMGLPLLPVTLPGLVELVAGCPLGAVVSGPLHQPEWDQTVSALRAVEPSSVLVDEPVEAAPDPRAVTRLALELRAASLPT